jgi:hypothetical protein
MAETMTRAEALAFNSGVEAVLEIARRTAAAIAGTSRRRVHEDFAVAALNELAESARALLIPVPNDAEPRRRKDRNRG